MIDPNLIRQLVGVAIEGGKLLGGESPAFRTVTAGLGLLLGKTTDPALAGEQVRLDAGLADAVKARRAAFDRARRAGSALPRT